MAVCAARSTVCACLLRGSRERWAKMITDGYLASTRPASDEGAAEDARRCPRCGADNDPDYRYCGDCVTRIS
jgi:hypothetical protein